VCGKKCAGFPFSGFTGTVRKKVFFEVRIGYLEKNICSIFFLFFTGSSSFSDGIPAGCAYVTELRPPLWLFASSCVSGGEISTGFSFHCLNILPGKAWEISISSIYIF
jgi:hypothetical protein